MRIFQAQTVNGELLNMTPAPLLRVDLHSHTHYSRDAWTSPALLVERARDAGIDRIAVTDHGGIDGALVAHELDPARVIVGEEVHSHNGLHVIGLFLTERIPNGLSVPEIAERIHAQGGVVYAPHPFAYVPHGAERAAEVLTVADVVEAFNSRAFWKSWNPSALAEATRRGLPVAAGTDAHFPWEFGRAYAEMPAFRTASEFRASVRDARAVGVRLGSPWLHVGSIALEFGRRVVRSRAPQPVPLVRHA